MNPAKIEELMIRFLQGTCSPEEKSLFDSWLQESEENRQQYYEIKMLWHASRIEYYQSEEQLRKALDRFSNAAQESHQGQKGKIYRSIIRYAAIFIGVLVVSWIFLVLGDGKKSPAQTLTVTVSQTDSSKLVMLGDGTRIWLNNNSSITYPEQFSGKERVVRLEGEAYFDVTHDASHPFVINTPSMRIKVLGTSFNVHAYPGNDLSEAVLVKGKIAIVDSAGNSLKVMQPGQLAVFDRSSQNLLLKEVDPGAYASWRYGQISFREASLKNITNKLSELYGVEFSIGSSINDSTRYNFTFSKKKAVKEVMDMLSFIAPIQYQVEGKKILISPK